MGKAKRAGTTVYLHPDVARSAKARAALTGKTYSDFVNDAVVQALREDDEDLRAIRESAREPEKDFEDVLKDLRRRGLI